MQGISSKVLQFGDPVNKFKYNGGSELENEEFLELRGLECYTTEHSKYDPQLGRWHQIGPQAGEILQLVWWHAE